eukprot:5013547-Alexandrium_andersonii.AAC.1
MARACPGSLSVGDGAAPASPARLGSSLRPRVMTVFARALRGHTGAPPPPWPCGRRGRPCP